MTERFDSQVVPPGNVTEPALWFAFRGTEVLVLAGGSDLAVPCCRDPEELGIATLRRSYLGRFKGRHCYACEMPEGAAAPAGMRLSGLRDLLLRDDAMLGALAGRAFQIIEWDRTHLYCGACGADTETLREERARRCTRCARVFYPRVSPVVMGLVTRGRELLLARKPGYAAGRYTVFTGFVEPGETLEQGMAREVREEVGIEITGLDYHGSQPWPFPHSLVIAFHARYAGGEVRPDPAELEDARWFDFEALPSLPEPIHISRRLIDATIARLKGPHGQRA
jgi:NAD+ diphosphatase